MLDRIEQVVLLAFFAMLCWRLLPDSLDGRHWHSLMILLSESTLLVFVLIRRPTERITLSPADWAVAFSGTIAPLLVEARSTVFLPDLGIALMVIGWLLHFSAKLTLRRSFGVAAAERGVKTRGPYALVRHPMYLGYLVTHIGFFLAVPSFWNYAVYAIAWICFTMRMRTEERVLMRTPEYQACAAKVRYRLIPLLW